MKPEHRADLIEQFIAQCYGRRSTFNEEIEDAITQAINDAVGQEREECAKIALETSCPASDADNPFTCGDEIAEKIRARSVKEVAA